MNKIKITISNPGYGPHIRQSLLAYKEADMLDCFYTTFLIPNNYLTRLLSNNFKGIKSKQLDIIPVNKIKKMQFPELLRLFSSKFLSSGTTDKIWEWSELLFDHWVANKIGLKTYVFHGYEHACLYSLQKCKKYNIFSVYEQPSAHHSYVNEYILMPLLASEKFFDNNFKLLYNSDLSKKRNIRRDAELTAANIIVCNSSYVKKTLVYDGVAEEKIVVLPLGFPTISKRLIAPKSKLRFVISGNLSYLKGTHHVLRVWKNHPDIFNNHELVCIGHNTLSEAEWYDLPDNVIRMNRLNREDYLNELHNADVYILNTYSDGFGMVMSEAMSYGLAVIGTENSAAPDILENNITGKIIPVGNESKLLDAMKWMMDNQMDLYKMRIASMKYASEHSWEHYRLELPKIIYNKYLHFKKNG